MNNFPAVSAYRAPAPQQQNTPGNNEQQQTANSNQAQRPLFAPHTVKAFGGEARFQPVPTLTFTPRAYASLQGSISPIPGVLSINARKSVQLDPVIRISPTNTGGLNVSFTPRFQLELTGSVSAGLTDILGTKLGVNGGGGVSKRLNFSAAEFNFNVEPKGTVKLGANFNPAIGTQQSLSVNGGVGLGVPGVGVGVNQAFTQTTSQEVKVGGPSAELVLSAGGRPQVTTNFDRSITITNNYTFSPRTSVNGFVQAGPLRAGADVGGGPTFTVQHRLTLNTDLSKNIPPKNEFSTTMGASADANFYIRASLLPPEWPVSLTAEVGFNPRGTVTGGGSYTI
ncbi:hypothetical protein [Pseudomonas sp.]|uniref:hypothetical protein n=1 Tax=Pseudomonas sp. TaxID=306 RepID=UPI003C517422